MVTAATTITTTTKDNQETQQIMKKISLEKIVLNMGLGKSGDVIETGKKCLEQISGKKPNARKARETLRDWGVRKGEPIGVAVTVRGQDAVALLKRLIEAKGNTLNGRSFDNFWKLFIWNQRTHRYSWCQI